MGKIFQHCVVENVYESGKNVKKTEQKVEA